MEEGNQETQQPTAPQKTSKLSPMLVGGIIIAAILLIIGYFFAKGQTQSQQTTTQGTESQMMQEPTTTEAMMQDETMSQGEATNEASMGDEESMMEEVTTVNVEGGNYYFDPNEITVKSGQPVKIVFTNAGGMHDFVIDEFDVATKITQTGETVEVEFTPHTAGTYEYYCNVANHRALGMVGTLIVE